MGSVGTKIHYASCGLNKIHKFFMLGATDAPRTVLQMPDALLADPVYYSTYITIIHIVAVKSRCIFSIILNGIPYTKWNTMYHMIEKNGVKLALARRSIMFLNIILNKKMRVDDVII